MTVKNFSVKRKIIRGKDYSVSIPFEILCQTRRFKCPRCGTNSWGYCEVYPDYAKQTESTCTECHLEYGVTALWYWWNKIKGRLYITIPLIKRRYVMFMIRTHGFLWKPQLTIQKDRGIISDDYKRQWIEDDWLFYWLCFCIEWGIRRDKV